MASGCQGTSAVPYSGGREKNPQPATHAKRKYWRGFCSSIGRTTPVGEVWGMIKKMSGIRREWDYPVLVSGGEKAVTDKEKAEMMAKTFVAIHSSDKLEGEWKKGREMTLKAYPGVLEKREEVGDALSAPMSNAEMERAIARPGLTSPGEDEMFYIMFSCLGEVALGRLKGIYDALIKSVIDYGCIAYRDAARATLAKLDVVQTQALRIFTGAFHMSPAVAMQVEMGEMPLQLRREQLAANYWANLQGQGRSHPTRAVMQVCWEHERVKNHSFGWVGDAIGKERERDGT